jgi:hypothetical protein
VERRAVTTVDGSLVRNELETRGVTVQVRPACDCGPEDCARCHLLLAVLRSIRFGLALLLLCPVQLPVEIIHSFIIHFANTLSLGQKGVRRAASKHSSRCAHVYILTLTVALSVVFT